MPFIVEVEELKKVVRLVAGLKDVSPEAQKKFHWNGFHRVIAEDDQFRLLTTDGSFFLDWQIPVVGGLNGDDFDLKIPAGQFNEMISYASTVDPFELEYLPSSERLVFHQGQRTLRLEATPTGPYPPAPTVVGSPSWFTDAQRLSKQLSFMAPIIDAPNPNVARSVTTLSSPGVLTGGSPGRFAVVTGLASPPSPVNLKQKSAKTLAAFLDALTGSVDVTNIPGSGGGESLLFATPDTLRSIIVYGEPRPFPDLLGKLESEKHEAWQVDRKSWLHGTNIVHAVQPRGTNGLTLRIRGDGDHSSMTISSSNNPVLASHDEFQIHRKPFTGEGNSGNSQRADDVLAVNAETVRESLQAMKGDGMTVKHYSKRKMLMIQDAAVANEPVRSIFLTVVPANANAADTDAAPPEHRVGDAQDGPTDISPNPLTSEGPEPAPAANPDDQVETSTEEESSSGGEEESTESNPPVSEALEPALTANPDDQTETSTEEETSATLEREATPGHGGSAEAPTANSNQGETRRSRRNSPDRTVPRTNSRSGD